MIPETILARIAHNAGVEDETVVRLDVVSVYLLQALHDAGLLAHMAFKGGNALRKIFARKGTRFSRDLDFVDVSYEQLSDPGHKPDYYFYNLLEHLDGRTIHGIRWQLASIPNEALESNTLRVDAHFFIYGDEPTSAWEERTDNVLVLELSFRRPVLLTKEMRPLREEKWFRHLEFEPAHIPVLQQEEALAEKIRAAFQRNNPRDVYDLYQYGQYGGMPFNQELVRTMAVLKCWQDRGTHDGPTNFDPELFLAKLMPGTYNWERLRDQVSAVDWIEPPVLLQTVRQRFAFLAGLTELEHTLCADRWQRRQDIHDAVWAQFRPKVP